MLRGLRVFVVSLEQEGEIEHCIYVGRRGGKRMLVSEFTPMLHKNF